LLRQQAFHIRFDPVFYSCLWDTVSISRIEPPVLSGKSRDEGCDILLALKAREQNREKMSELLSTIKNKIFCLIQLWFKRFSIDCTTTLPQGPILIIAPHPDDETIGCGAVIAQSVAEGRKVHVIIVTDGRASAKSVRISSDDLARIRREETLQAIEKLGLSKDNLFFLSYPDGQVANYIDAISKEIASHLARFSPALVFTPHSFDEHEDHRALSAIVKRLQDEGAFSFLLFQYPFWSRSLCLPYGILRCLVTPSLYRCCRHFRVEGLCIKKEEALLQYRSQFENLTGEKNWRFFSVASRKRFCGPFELFFEGAGRKENKTESSS
jgi:hypothetical protein